MSNLFEIEKFRLDQYDQADVERWAEAADALRRFRAAAVKAVVDMRFRQVAAGGGDGALLSVDELDLVLLVEREWGDDCWVRS